MRWPIEVNLTGDASEVLHMLGQDDVTINLLVLIAGTAAVLIAYRFLARLMDRYLKR